MSRTKVLLLVGVFSGTSLLLFGLVTIFSGNSLIQKIIKKSLILTPGSKTYDNFKEIPIAIRNDIYLFNITNPETAGIKEPPHVQAIGPFVYMEKRKKVNLTESEDGNVIEYEQKRQWFFDPENSVGDLDDFIYHLNVPLVSSGDFVRKQPEKTFMYYAINELAERTNSSLFPRHNIRELLFEGYVDPFITEPEDFIKIPYDKFGWFYPKNDSATDGRYEVYTGRDDLNLLGQMYKWNNMTVLDDSRGVCSSLDGVSGSDFQPPYPSKVPPSIKIFVGDICRSLKLNYDSDVTHFGVKTNRYVADQRLFDYGMEENQCYCPEGVPCPPNGVANVSKCVFDAPAAISLPHFLYGNGSLTSYIQGLQPNSSKHGFMMDIFPDFGIPLRVQVAMQINVVLQKDTEMNFAKDLQQDEVYYPMVYFVSTAELTSDMASQLKLVQNLPQILEYVSGALILIGILIIGLTIYLQRRFIIHLIRERKSSYTITSVM